MSQVRKLWLFSFWLYWGISIAFIIPFAMSTLFESVVIPEVDVKNIEMIDVKTMMIFIRTVTIGSLFIGAWIIYHCAYKKRGTKWLMWTLIAFSVSAFISFFQLFIPNSPIKILLFHSVSGWIPGLFGLTWLSAVYFWINCFRLRKENLLLKEKVSFDPEVHIVVRKQWRHIFFLVTILSGLLGSLLFGNVWNKLFLVPVWLGWSWTTYYFSYKKQGTKWLMWMLIILPFSILMSFSLTMGYFVEFFVRGFSKREILSPYPFDKLIETSGFFIIAALSLVFHIRFLINCSKLRKGNLALKNLTLAASDVVPEGNQ